MKRKPHNTVTLQVYCSPSFKRFMEKKAHESGRTTSEFCRWILKGTV